MKRKKQLPQLILGVSTGNFIIYIISLAVSIIFIGLGFIPCKFFETWATLFMSVGASGLGAAVLAFLIERSNNILQAKKISNVRREKLCVIEVSALCLLERVVYWCFRKRFEVFSCDNSDKCHKITYDEIWEELDDVENALSNIYNDGTISNYDENRVNTINKAVVSRCTGFIKTIEQLSIELKLFEATGFFSNEEVLDIEAASMCCGDVGHYLDCLEIDSLKSVFEQLTNIPEFKHFLSFELYYKNNYTIYKTEEMDYKGKKDKFSQEDLTIAITHEDRKKDKLTYHNKQE